MKQILSPVLILILILSGGGPKGANANSTIEASGMDPARRISRVFENFRYRMSVLPPETSGDRARASATLKEELERLTAEGIPASLVMEQLKQDLLDQQTRQDFELWLGTLDADSTTPEEAAELASRFLEKRHAEGAHFSGGGKPSYRLIWILTGVIAIGVVTWLWVRHCRMSDGGTLTLTQTETDTQFQTLTETLTQTLTQTQTETVTQTDFGYCCNRNTGNTVSASPTGCANGQALYWVPSPELCVEID
jgi:hypothetical protein